MIWLLSKLELSQSVMIIVTRSNKRDALGVSYFCAVSCIFGFFFLKNTDFFACVESEKLISSKISGLLLPQVASKRTSR